MPRPNCNTTLAFFIRPEASDQFRALWEEWGERYPETMKATTLDPDGKVTIKHEYATLGGYAANQPVIEAIQRFGKPETKLVLTTETDAQEFANTRYQNW